jgi:hypothetical protein
MLHYQLGVPSIAVVTSWRFERSHVTDAANRRPEPETRFTALLSGSCDAATAMRTAAFTRSYEARYGSISTELGYPRHVRFPPDSDLILLRHEFSLSA